MMSNKSKNLVVCATFISTIYSTTVVAQELVTDTDIERFGWEYLGNYVSMYGVLDDVRTAKHPKNKGRIVATLEYNENPNNIGIFIKGFSRKDIEPHLGSCVKVSGFVEEVAAGSFGSEYTVVSLSIDRIEATGIGNFCKTKLGKIIEDAKARIRSIPVLEDGAPETTRQSNGEDGVSNELFDALSEPVVTVD